MAPISNPIPTSTEATRYPTGPAREMAVRALDGIEEGPKERPRSWSGRELVPAKRTGRAKRSLRRASHRQSTTETRTGPYTSAYRRHASSLSDKIRSKSAPMVRGQFVALGGDDKPMDAFAQIRLRRMIAGHWPFSSFLQTLLHAIEQRPTDAKEGRVSGPTAFAPSRGRSL